MSISNVKLILMRELRDQLRDRRTLFTIAVLPLLLYPLLGMAFLQVAQFTQQHPTKIWVIGANELAEDPVLIRDSAFPPELCLSLDVSDLLQLELEEDPQEVIIRLVQTGGEVQYFFDEWPVADYNGVLRQVSALPRESLVVIDAGATVAYRHVVGLYNHCLRSSIERVIFPVSGATGRSGAPRL